MHMNVLRRKLWELLYKMRYINAHTTYYTIHTPRRCGRSTEERKSLTLTVPCRHTTVQGSSDSHLTSVQIYAQTIEPHGGPQ